MKLCGIFWDKIIIYNTSPLRHVVMLANYPLLDIAFLLYVKYINSKNMEKPNLSTNLTISLKSPQYNVQWSLAV